MNKIEVKILNPEVIPNSERMMVCAARLTQRGHQIKNMDDFMDLYNKAYTEKTVANMVQLPHPTIQKFGIINIVIVGASRRFLAQITRHQNEVKYMSASCQYSDYSGEADFVIPYGLSEAAKNEYILKCKGDLDFYENMIANGVDCDSAAYALPQGLRNVLIISATPYQWKHMIAQRICRRNTSETRYIMLKIWKELYRRNHILFGSSCGPFCLNGTCKEGKMACGNKMSENQPDIVLQTDFPLLMKGATNET